MAIDKAVDSEKLDREMKATADAIREKGKTEADIPWKDEIGFKQAVLAITGGADLNFEVVGGTSEPENPKDDIITIWVETEQEITGWVFDFTAPASPTKGMVWFMIGTSSDAEFDALKENGIMIYPISAKQYTGSAWEPVGAMGYQDGKWVNWIIYLYHEGDECTDITGGWTTNGYTAGGYDIGASKNDNSITTKFATGQYNGGIGTTNKVDLTGKNAIVVEVEDASTNFTVYYSAQKTNFNDNAIFSKVFAPPIAATIEVQIPSTVDQAGYIILFCSSATIHNVWTK